MDGKGPTPSALWRLLALLSICAPLTSAHADTTAFRPTEAQEQPWRIHSFTRDSGLEGQNVFDIAFRRSPGTNSVETERVWVASSDGLAEYDGYSWKRHRRSSGLPSDFIRCVLLTRSGNLWVGSDRGAGIFTGHSYNSKGSEQHLAGMNVRRIVEDPDGTLWFCSDSWPDAKQTGGLTSFRGGEWKIHRTQDGLPSDYVMDYLRDSAGRQFVITLKGAAELIQGRWVPITILRNGTEAPLAAVSLADAPGRGTIFSDGESTYSFREGRWQEDAPAQRHQHGLCVTADGALLATLTVGPGQKVFAEWRSNGWERVSSTFQIAQNYSETLREAPDGSVWAVGFDTLVNWQRSNPQWVEIRGVPMPRLIDGGGRIWFSQTDPIDRDRAIPVRYDRGRWDQLDQPYHILHAHPDGSVWGWTSNAVVRWQGDGERRFGEAETGLRTVLAGEPDRKGTLWTAGTDPSGKLKVVRYDGRSWTTLQVIEAEGASRLLGIRAGVEGCWLILEWPGRSDLTSVRLHGANERTRSIPLPRGALSQFRYDLAADSSDRTLWLYGESGLFRWQENQPAWEVITNIPGRATYGFAERQDGVWFACNGATGGTNALVRFHDERWTLLPAAPQFDVSLAADNTLMIGGRGHFTIVPGQQAQALIGVNLPTDRLVRAVLKDSEGHYWAGGFDSLFRYMPNHYAPETRIERIETNVLTGQTIRLTAVGVERSLPVGSASDYRFSWKIDDQPWSAFLTSSTLEQPTTGLPTGEHRIQVRCQHTGMDLDPTPASVDFTLHPLPVQDQVWFLPAILLVISLLGGFAFVAVKARIGLSNYAQTLEQRVAERTAELEADIQARQEAEMALRESEERITSIVDNLNEGLVVADFDGQLLHWNPAAVEMHSFDSSDELCRPLSELSERFELSLLDGTVLGIDRWPLSRIYAGETVRDLELRLRRRDTNWDRVFSYSGATLRDAKGHRIAFLTIVDVTARKQAERRLTTQHAVSRVLAESGSLKEAAPRIMQGICDSEGLDFGVLWELDPDTEELRCLEVWHRPALDLGELAAAKHRTRFNRGEGLPGRVWSDARPVFLVEPAPGKNHPNASLIRQHALKSALAFPILAHGEVIGVAEFLGREIQACDAKLLEVFGAIGRQVGLFFDRKHAEEREARLEHQLQQAQKMEAIGQLSGGIAHDFNNILGAILGNAQLAAMETSLPESCRTCLTEIRDAGLRAKKLVQQILTYSRQQVPERRVISLAPIVDECTSLMRATLPAGVELVRVTAPSTPNVMGDPTQIHQVIVNLCTNAWQALAGEPGRIEIRLEGLTLDAASARAAGNIRPGRYAALSVTDTGKGMDAETLEHAFEPFFTTKKVGEGTGLGLAVVHGVIKSHDGAIRVVTAPGKGTSLHLYFPEIRALAELPQQEPSPARRGAGQRILYLDDEEALVSLASRALKHLGYEVHGFTKAEDAIDHCRSHPGLFDVLVTDLNMPGRSGLQVAAEIRTINPTLPIVLSTGFITEDLKNTAQKLGIDHLLYKPNTVEELGRALNKILVDRRTPRAP